MTSVPAAIAAPTNAASRRALLLALVLVALGWTWLSAPKAPAPTAGDEVQPAFAAYPEPPPDLDNAEPVSLRRLAEQPTHPDLMPPAPLPALAAPALAWVRAVPPPRAAAGNPRRHSGEARAPPALPTVVASLSAGDPSHRA